MKQTSGNVPHGRAAKEGVDGGRAAADALKYQHAGIYKTVNVFIHKHVHAIIICPLRLYNPAS